MHIGHGFDRSNVGVISFKGWVINYGFTLVHDEIHDEANQDEVLWWGWMLNLNIVSVNTWIQ